MPDKANDKIPFELPWWTKAYNWFRKWGWVPLGFILLILGLHLRWCTVSAS